MTKDEALRLAWDALEDIGDEWGFTSERTVPKRKEAIAAIKEALAHPQQEAIYGMNPDDWKDLTDAVKKVRDGRGMPLACQPADVFQDWFLWLGTAKIKERNT
tara:strand:- start:2082 stop:2390 length:309 start_codon:yes stop_codon:yes gene_type:complete